MKKSIYFATLLAALMAMAACTSKEDDLFDTTASERSTNEMVRIKTLLKSAPNGWHMDYYGDLYYGGYNVMMQFTDDSVTVASEKAGTGHNAGLDANGKCITATSHYKLEQSMGIVLSVDEYNDVFHYFSMPNNPNYGTKDEGFYGDFEFRVITARADSIIMRGKKHGDRIVMTPVPEDTSWEQLIQDAADTQTFIDSRNYTLEGADGFNSGAVAVKQYHTFVFEYTDSVGQLQTVTAPFISKKDGYHFYSTVDVKGIKLDGIIKGETNDKFVLSNDATKWLYPYLPTLVEHLTGSAWYIAYSQLGTYAQSKWDEFNVDLAKSKTGNEDPQVRYAIFGYCDKNTCLFINIDGNITIWHGFSYSKNEDETEITLKWDASKNNDRNNRYYNKYGMKKALDPFVGTYGRTFKIETDNQRNPSYLRLIDINESTNVITLSATPVYYPFNN